MVRKSMLILLFIYSSLNFVYAEGESKIDMIRNVEQEQEKDKNISKLENYDVDLGTQSIDKNIENVKKMKEEVLDRLGKNKNCYLVANKISILEKRIKSKSRFKGSIEEDKNIKEMEEIIEDVKKICPNYLKFKGDK